MAQVKIEDIVDHLSSEFRRALEDTFAAHAPNVRIDSYQVFRDFRRAVYRKCNVWENVPDQFVNS